MLFHGLCSAPCCCVGKHLSFLFCVILWILEAVNVPLAALVNLWSSGKLSFCFYLILGISWYLPAFSKDLSFKSAQFISPSVCVFSEVSPALHFYLYSAVVSGRIKGIISGYFYLWRLSLCPQCSHCYRGFQELLKKIFIFDVWFEMFCRYVWSPIWSMLWCSPEASFADFLFQLPI